MIRKPTWIILAVFALVLLVYLYFDVARKTNDIAGTPTPAVNLPALPAGSLSNVSSIVYKDGSKVILSLKKNMDGNWMFSSDSDAVLNQARIDELLSNLESLKVQSVLPAPSNPKELGLSPAKTEIDLINSNQEIVTILVGDQTPTGSGYYFQVNNTNTVIVGKGGWETIADLLTKDNLIISATVSP